MKHTKTVTKKEESETVTCDVCGKDCTCNHITCSICGRDFCGTPWDSDKPNCMDDPKLDNHLARIRQELSKYPCKFCIGISKEYAPQMSKLFKEAQAKYREAYELEKKWGKESKKLS